MYLTWLDNNSWLVEIGSKRVLIDPWLVDELVFANLDWLFKASHPTQRAIPENIDLIILSQGWEDHAHPPTLKVLDHNIPVVASPNAAKVVQGLGYTNVTALTHWENLTFHQNLQIQATPGSLVGATLVENGYLIKDLETGLSIYYEPHGTHPPSLKEVAPVDVVITPLIDLALPLVGSLIKGGKSALKLAQILQPQVMLPTAAGGEVVYEGFINKLLQSIGSIEEFRTLLAENNLSTEVIEPRPGDRIELKLQPKVTCVA
ncbi:hypothetical protein Cri9333_0253 [Crinalium epipsammum PCC 9333]|uniref:MBL fold metallo-hydrolase n=1 Tax=Crinalium epipsammum PCC 9333 TaxID=1173022 RepID=K9VVN7_9CYAN|nr:MBL fold metallo-hydrolase [Crinalium epipsammum]AFZ11245.1 hypothetical protein Cri9333_0253 [Crinalium epipsammum PCC 9333]